MINKYITAIYASSETRLHVSQHDLEQGSPFSTF